jgi:hypothetical protein
MLNARRDEDASGDGAVGVDRVQPEALDALTGLGLEDGTIVARSIGILGFTNYRAHRDIRMPSASPVVSPTSTQT